jgi:hypothetical protein
MFCKSAVFTVMFLLVGVTLAAAQSGEFVDTSVDAFGYAFKLPKEFALKGKIESTTTWEYRPGSVGGTPGSPAGVAGSKEPALTISVNRVAIETPTSSQLYQINREIDMDAAKAPDAGIRDLKDLTIENGYGYWYKETDKSDPNAMHRWIVRLFGNNGVYTIALAGPFKEFEEWGPAYEQVIESFQLITLKVK